MLLTAATLVQTINTFEYSPPSPDPAGIVYLPASDTLLISDSEVNEMSIFTGDNLFESTLSGNLVRSFSTTTFSDEPTGVTLNPTNGHLFFSDDTGARKIFELNPGSDGLYGTSDDSVTSFSTSDFGSRDPEGLAYDYVQDRLYVVDGADARLYAISPGMNGVFDGVDPVGDDQVSDIDLAPLGLSDPEGVAFHSETGNLYLVGNPVDTLFEMTTEGTLVQLIDVSAADARKLSDITFAPSSADPNVMHVYLTDRGIDNGRDPDENDGRIYEMALGDADPGPITLCAVSTHDAYINQEQPDENKGDDNDLKVKPDSGKERRILTEFDVSFIPQNSSIVAATLMLYEDNVKDNQTLLVHRLTKSWDESQVTWDQSDDSTPWITAGGDFDPAIVASFAPDIEGEFQEIDISAAVQAWINGTSPNHGLLVRSTGANGEVKFKSREEGNSDKHPQLCVTYVASPSGNQRPTVDAGPDQTVIYPGTVNLDAEVNDDGNPDPPAQIEVTWTQVSGPGTVAFADPSAADTAASFSETGTYVLRLNADDGELSATDDVTVTVNPNVVTHCALPTQDAYLDEDHPDENQGDNNDLKVKPDSGKERRILTQFDLDFVPPNSDVIDATLMLYEDNHKDDQAIFVHRVTGSWNESQVTWDLSEDATPWLTPGGDFDPTIIASFAPDLEDEYREIDVSAVVQEWLDGTWPNDGLLLRSTGANGEVKFKSREEGDSDKQPQFCVTYGISPPQNQGPTVNAGPDQTVTHPGAVLLDARVSDDGTPDPPGAVETTWTQISGPGTVTFADPAATSTSASFPAVGNYLLRLTADDGEQTTSDDVLITVVAGEVQMMYFTYSPAAGFPGGLAVDIGDIISFDGTNYNMVVDGSDIGLNGLGIDAIKFMDADEILLSFVRPVSLPGITGEVDDSDIVKFTATELGDTTAGTFTLYFDGSDVGLEAGTEDVDAIELLTDGSLLVSTTGDSDVLPFTVQGGDILAFTPTALGETTAGTWSLYFDGEDVGLSGVGVDGISVSDGGDLFLTSSNSFNLPELSAKDEDVFIFQPSSLGEQTAGTFASALLFDGSHRRAGGDLKALDFTTVQISTPPPIDFRVMGDVPYTPEQQVSLEQDLADLVASDTFFVHLGDITSDGSPCTESVYTNMSSTLTAASIPAFIVPGDNEWTECADPNQAWDLWEANLMRLDEHWSHNFNISRQPIREENFAFVHQGVLFIGINLVGGNVHDASEWAQRMTDDANWVSDNFSAFKGQVTSAVVFAHAFADPNQGDRQQFGQDFVAAADAFGKPILYLMGDLHNWDVNHPYVEAPNVTRVTVNSGVPSVRVTVTHDPGNPFAFDQRLGDQPSGDEQPAALDANGDGNVSAADALVIINFLGSQDETQAEGELAVSSASSRHNYDANGDGTVSAIDALQVINYLSRDQVTAVVAEAPAPQLETGHRAALGSIEDDLIQLLADDQSRL